MVVRTVRRLFISVHIELVGYGHVLVRSLLEVDGVVKNSFFAIHGGSSHTVVVLV